MRTALLNLLRDEAGATAIEYGLIAVLVAAVAFGGISALGANNGKTLFSDTADVVIAILKP